MVSVGVDLWSPSATDKPLPIDPDKSGSFNSASRSPHSCKNWNRTQSDTMTMLQSIIKSSKHPEADTIDLSEAIVLYTNSEPDPFRADAPMYYTPKTLNPPPPPRGTHSRTASREEDIIWPLCTQLALQQESCGQYENGLSACDKLVEAPTGQARERTPFLEEESRGARKGVSSPRGRGGQQSSREHGEKHHGRVMLMQTRKLSAHSVTLWKGP
ncbi:hypothetical protein PAXRUDRAFT_760230 [Paxillus rubicundulus Ve08.2h10]|uniref:Uncharacterized protein n=1 Tax=Paxillus rubicundulus Ve08.2h10 TaxID=930991 RepID=A0A0D0EBK2_9AGAM|nr:hypothetical protein PAXRUDRAFT_760230 [Paxillus rubicundulus Ve08.2h10]